MSNFFEIDFAIKKLTINQRPYAWAASCHLFTNYLITKSEVVTGKSQTEALPYCPSDSEVNTVGRGLRFSRNNRTVEVIKLFIIWLMNYGKEKNYSSGSRQFTSGDARVYRFIHRLKPSAKLHSELNHCITYSVKNTFLYRKLIVTASKRYLVSWCQKLMGEFFRLLWRNVNAYRKDRKCFKIVQTN